jgi:peroxiredoxin
MNKSKLTGFLSALIVCICWGISCPFSFGDDSPEEFKLISAGMKIPQFVLHPPGSVEDQKYLGLKDPNPFSIDHISAKIVILEVFSFYCPHCRNLAPAMNKLYGFIQQDTKLSNDIKMIGIGAGTEKSKTDLWKTSMRVPFPLFSDADTSIWKKLGKPGLPCTLVVSKSGEVLITHFGVIEDIEAFFSSIKEYHKNKE